MNDDAGLDALVTEALLEEARTHEEARPSRDGPDPLEPRQEATRRCA